MSKCKVCTKSVYPMDPQINLDGALFHKPCAKCADCKCQITISNFTKGEQDGQLILLCKTHYFKRFKEGGSYVGGEKFQVKSTRDVQASSRRSSTVDSAAVTTNSSAPDIPSTNGSVRDRIANIRLNEKPKTENTTTASQPSSRKPSIDVTKFSESKVVEPVTSATPEKAPVPAPVSAPVVETVPAPVVVEDAPVAAPQVPEPAVATVEATVVPPPAPESTTVNAEPVSSPSETPVNDTVIDASPENGVSTPYIPANEKEVDVVEVAADVPVAADAAAETESTSQSEESN